MLEFNFLPQSANFARVQITQSLKSSKEKRIIAVKVTWNKKESASDISELNDFIREFIKDSVAIELESGRLSD